LTTDLSCRDAASANSLPGRGHNSVLERVERKTTERILNSIMQKSPSEWQDDDLDEMKQPAERLYNRRIHGSDGHQTATGTKRTASPCAGHLRDAGIESLDMGAFAAWAPKLKAQLH
jgi:hypothetical protein